MEGATATTATLLRHHGRHLSNGSHIVVTEEGDVYVMAPTEPSPHHHNHNHNNGLFHHHNAKSDERMLMEEAEDVEGRMDGDNPDPQMAEMAALTQPPAYHEINPGEKTDNPVSSGLAKQKFGGHGDGM